MFFGGRKKQGWIAISLHGDRIDLAHVRRNAEGRPQIVYLESFRTEGDVQAALSRLKKELKLSQYRCVTLLGQGEYQILQVEAPNVPEAEMRDAVRWRLKDMLDYPVQSATIDVLEIPVNGAGAGRVRSIFAIAANNSVVGSRMNLFDTAYIPLEVIDIPELAQRNLAALFEENNRGLALLSFNEYGGLLTFTCEGELYASRRIEITLNQLIESDADHRHRYLERIGLELQRSLDLFDRQHSAVSLRQLLLTPIPGVPELNQYLGANLDVPVEPLDLAYAVDFSAVPELENAARQAQCLQTIGAALRMEEAAA